MNRIFPTLLVLSCLTLSSTAFAQTAGPAAAEIVGTDASAQAAPARSATPASAATQGLQIPPTAAQIQLQQQRAKEAARQQALKAQADAKEAKRQEALKAKKAQADAKEAERQEALKAKKAQADAKQAERQQALKAKVDALQADVTALKNGEPTRQVPPTQTERRKRRTVGRHNDQ